MSRAALGSLLGAAIAACVAFVIRPLFDPPLGGVGFVTVNAYPKSWDYAVVGLLVAGACAGALMLTNVGRGFSPPLGGVGETRGGGLKPRPTLIALVVFALMLVVHDHPYAHMDPFHEGEHLTPARLFLEGVRPYGDVFVLHGLGVDGGLDALVGARPLYTRRLQTVLDAATLALLVPIAAEVTVSLWGMLGGVALSLCGMAALWVPVFPYFRLAPVLLAALGLLRYARTGRAGPLLLAFTSATLGVLWSLDTGTYALAGTVIAFALLPKRLPLVRVAILAAIALALPFVVLLVVRADVVQFVRDSFVVIPRAIDAVWALPAPKVFSAAGLRYYLPPVFYGLLLAIGWKRRDPRFLVVALLSIFLFRTAAGRVSWSHTRFATPLLGIAFVALVLEPRFLRESLSPLSAGRGWREAPGEGPRLASNTPPHPPSAPSPPCAGEKGARGTLPNRIAMALVAIAAILYFEVPQNAMAGAKLLASWPARQKHEGLVRHPLAPGIYTSEDNATQLATLKGFVDSMGPGTILDFTNERALYFLLRRKPAMRCFDIPMLSAYPLMNEASLQLQAKPPIAVILGGDPAVAVFDGVPNQDRVPELARWIDVTYPKRTQIGRFVVATR